MCWKWVLWTTNCFQCSAFVLEPGYWWRNRDAWRSKIETICQNVRRPHVALLHWSFRSNYTLLYKTEWEPYSSISHSPLADKRQKSWNRVVYQPLLDTVAFRTERGRKLMRFAHVEQPGCVIAIIFLKNHTFPWRHRSIKEKKKWYINNGWSTIFGQILSSLVFRKVLQK